MGQLRNEESGEEAGGRDRRFDPQMCFNLQTSTFQLQPLPRSRIIGDDFKQTRFLRCIGSYQLSRT